jgi:hypothetical protein
MDARNVFWLGDQWSFRLEEGQTSINYCGNLSKLQFVAAYILRFIEN